MPTTKLFGIPFELVILLAILIIFVIVTVLIEPEIPFGDILRDFAKWFVI